MVVLVVVVGFSMYIRHHKTGQLQMRPSVLSALKTVFIHFHWTLRSTRGPWSTRDTVLRFADNVIQETGVPGRRVVLGRPFAGTERGTEEDRTVGRRALLVYSWVWVWN